MDIKPSYEYIHDIITLYGTNTPCGVFVAIGEMTQFYGIILSINNKKRDDPEFDMNDTFLFDVLYRKILTPDYVKWSDIQIDELFNWVDKNIMVIMALWKTHRYGGTVSINGLEYDNFGLIDLFEMP